MNNVDLSIFYLDKTLKVIMPSKAAQVVFKTLDLASSLCHLEHIGS